jgi:hypothetical protein
MVHCGQSLQELGEFFRIYVGSGARNATRHADLVRRCEATAHTTKVTRTHARTYTRTHTRARPHTHARAHTHRARGRTHARTPARTHVHCSLVQSAPHDMAQREPDGLACIGAALRVCARAPVLRVRARRLSVRVSACMRACVPTCMHASVRPAFLHAACVHPWVRAPRCPCC